MRRPCRTQYPHARAGRAIPLAFSRSSVVAGANAADVVAVGVELANEAAAAIAVIVVTVVRGGDRRADDGGTDQAGADTPAQTLGFGLRGGGRDAAGDG